MEGPLYLEKRANECKFSILWECEDRTKNCLRDQKSLLKDYSLGASLVVQWLRVCLLMQGTRVRALDWEDPTCRGAAKPVSHNC